MIFHWLRMLTAAALVATVPVIAIAQDYPARQPIQLVVGFPPGGPTDIVGRVIAEQLSKQLNQSVVVVNKGGAGGTVGAAYVAGQKPDGYTLMLDVESVKTRAPAIYKKLQYDPIKDFSPIAKLAKQRNLLVVNPSLPVNNVRELIAYAKANPDKLNYSGTYAASSHVGGALFSLLNGINMTMVNYPGGSQPITDLIAGVVQVGFFTEATVAQHVKAGKLKALAVVGNDRSTQFPQLPTVKEAGAAPMDISPWFALTAPAGTPQPIIDRLHAAAKKITEDPAFAERLATIGAVPIHGSTPDSYTKESIGDIAYWKKFVVDAKFPMAE